MKPWMLLAAGLIGCGGPETSINNLVPEAAVTPPILEFGEQVRNEEAVLELFVANAGRATLSVSDITFGDADAGVWSVSETSNADIPPGETWTVDVSFTPDAFADFEGTLSIATNDRSNEVVSIPLTGTGVPAPAPEIEVSPPLVDFGDVDIGDGFTNFFVIENTGTADLEIGQIEQMGSGSITFAGPDPSNTALAAGASTTVLMLYAPLQDQGDEQILTIPSNDKDEPEVEVTLMGNGGGNIDFPEADIDCPGSATPPEWIDLDGSDSSDPGGQDLTYEWSIKDAPTGSQLAELSVTDQPETELFTDIAGDYRVQLVVTNEDGLPSVPAICEIEAVPVDELHIELTWDGPASDLDLHVIDGNGELFELPSDVCWCNPTPKWGAAGTKDDPRLDPDASAGFGPENVNIEKPADGTYRVFVHYFEENGDNAVTAIVKIYAFGQLVDTRQEVLTWNEVWDVGQVNWPDGTFGVANVEPSPAPTRQCF